MKESEFKFNKFIWALTLILLTTSHENLYINYFKIKIPNEFNQFQLENIVYNELLYILNEVHDFMEISCCHYHTYHSSGVIVGDFQLQLVPVLPGSILQVKSTRLSANPHPLKVHGVPVAYARRHNVVVAVRGIRAPIGGCQQVQLSQGTQAPEPNRQVSPVKYFYQNSYKPYKKSGVRYKNASLNHSQYFALPSYIVAMFI
jgi:hypothetical protein